MTTTRTPDSRSARPRSRRRLLAWSVAAALGLGAAGAGLALFQPWRLVTTRVVDEALPGAPTPGRTPAQSALQTPASSPGASPSATAAAGPTATPAAGPVDLAAGDFRSFAHETTGRVRLVRLADGGHAVRIEDLATTDGPDLRVWLSDRPVAAADDAGSGRWLDLGALRGNRGSLTYRVPAGTDLDGFESVVIWCRRFSVGFGAAPLTAA